MKAIVLGAVGSGMVRQGEERFGLVWYGTALRAGRRLLVEQRKKVVNVRRVGYRIVKSQEQVGVSQNEQRHGRRWFRESLKTVTYVALDNLEPTEVGRVVTEQARAAVTLAFARRMVRVKELPKRDLLHVPSSTKLLAMMRTTKQQPIK